MDEQKEETKPKPKRDPPKITKPQDIEEQRGLGDKGKRKAPPKDTGDK
jgi:hypothetical protein